MQGETYLSPPKVIDISFCDFVAFVHANFSSFCHAFCWNFSSIFRIYNVCIQLNSKFNYTQHIYNKKILAIRCYLRVSKEIIKFMTYKFNTISWGTVVIILQILKCDAISEGCTVIKLRWLYPSTSVSLTLFSFIIKEIVSVSPPTLSHWNLKVRNVMFLLQN